VNRASLAAFAILFVATAVVAPASAARADSGLADGAFARLPPPGVLQAIVDSTSESRLRRTIERLEAFDTRYVGTDSCRASAAWLVDRFEALGAYDVRVDTFRTWTWQDSVEAWNVLAVRRGTTRPHEHIILGGHYDSVSFESLADPEASAPGADDNGSGVAAVLEAAKILGEYETERTVVFACWSAEEEGLWGSRDFVGRALAESLDILLYLNVDAIGYNDVGGPDGIVYADSVSVAVAALAADIASGYLGLDYEPRVRPFGASDQNSFAEAGYRILDTSSNPLYSPYHHSANDLLVHIDTGIVRDIAAVNAAVVAAVALVRNEPANIPPETTLLETCAATHDTVGLAPTFRWRGVDFDGSVSSYALDVFELDHPNPRVGTRENILGPGETETTLDLMPGRYALVVTAIDDRGARDPSPARHEFTASGLLAPEVMVAAPFLGDTLRFRGDAGRLADPVTVFEGERLALTVVVDPSAYCGSGDRTSVNLAPFDGPDFAPSPLAITLRPSALDTAIVFVAPEPDGGTTTGWIPISPVAAPFDRGTLHVDDWLSPDIDEATHDAFYEDALPDADRWDPYEHIVDLTPTLPPPETLGRYGTVVWTLARDGGLLRAAQSTKGWKRLEGYVRAGGNLIVEGQAAAATLAGADPATEVVVSVEGSFLLERAGIENVGTTGNGTNPAAYGYAFCGATPVSPDAPVLRTDTLGVWCDVFETYGGLPWCEVHRPAPGADRLYLFDALDNPSADERPCATRLRATDGGGSVAVLGFPLTATDASDARIALESLTTSFHEWQAPSVLAYFSHDASPDSIVLSWYLDPADSPIGCRLDRSINGGPYRTVADSLAPPPAGRYRITDAAPPGSDVRYRLVVVEQSGAETVHGPFLVTVPLFPPDDDIVLTSSLPARGTVSLAYSVAHDHRWVTLAVYDVTGRLVSTLREGPHDAGRYEVEWNGRSSAGHRAASGVYFVRLDTGESASTRKVVLIR